MVIGWGTLEVVDRPQHRADTRRVFRCEVVRRYRGADQREFDEPEHHQEEERGDHRELDDRLPARDAPRTARAAVTLSVWCAAGGSHVTPPHNTSPQHIRTLLAQCPGGSRA